MESARRAMCLIERDRDGDSSVFESQEHEPVALRERNGSVTTVMWSTELPVSAAMEKFAPFLRDTDLTADHQLLTIAPNGYSECFSDDLQQHLADAREYADGLSSLRIDIVSESLGAIALEYRTFAPGFVEDKSVLAITSREIDAQCIAQLISESAVEPVAESIEQIVGAPVQNPLSKQLRES